MRLFSLRSHFGNSLAFILFVWSISFEPFNLIIVKAPLYICGGREKVGKSKM
jgi:hypothetical protein